MEDEVFQDWFKSTFVPFVSDKRKPVILFFDGHWSHPTYGTVKAALDENIIVACLPLFNRTSITLFAAV